MVSPYNAAADGLVDGLDVGRLCGDLYRFGDMANGKFCIQPQRLVDLQSLLVKHFFAEPLGFNGNFVYPDGQIQHLVKTTAIRFRGFGDLRRDIRYGDLRPRYRCSARVGHSSDDAARSVLGPHHDSSKSQN